jgi:hypothetical protein
MPNSSVRAGKAAYTVDNLGKGGEVRGVESARGGRGGVTGRGRLQMGG